MSLATALTETNTVTNATPDGRCPFCTTRYEIVACWSGWGMRSLAPCCPEQSCVGHVSWYFVRQGGALLPKPQLGWQRA